MSFQVLLYFLPAIMPAKNIILTYNAYFGKLPIAGKNAGNGVSCFMNSGLINVNAKSQEPATSAGFRFGAKGTHTSRTMMLEDLTTVLEACPVQATRNVFTAAIIEDNCLGKQTIATRKLSCQRMSELYSLDPDVSVFAAMLRIWQIDKTGQPLLALLCAIARDPLLAATVPAIIALPIGEEFRRDDMRRALRAAVGERLNENTLEKVVRHTASSWTQSGHFDGRTFKRRHAVSPTAGSVAYAMYLAHIAGFRGKNLFNNDWIAVLDCSPSRAKELALEAKQMRLLDLRTAGDVVEISFRPLDPTYEGD